MVDSEELKEILSFHSSHIKLDFVTEISHLFEECTFKKGEILISNRGLCETCYFLHSGFVRSYIVNHEETENTLWFGEKGDFITSFQVMHGKKKNNEIVVALTDCKVFSIRMDVFKKLIQEHKIIANIYIDIIESGYQYWENRFIIQSQLNVEKRYKEWIVRTKHLAPHVSLGVLAQYLNINQATLSRIRSKKDNH